MHVPDEQWALDQRFWCLFCLCLRVSVILPTCSLYPQQECAWTCIYTGHACRHLTSAVPWISKDRLLRQQCSWLLKQINKPLCMKWQKMCVGQSVAQSKNTCSWKPEFSTVEHGNQMDGRPLHVWQRPEISPVKFCADSYKSPLDEAINWGLPCVCICKMITYAHQRCCGPCRSLVNYGNKQK